MFMDEIDLVVKAADELRELLGPNEGVTIIWPRNAEALRLGPEGVLLSAMVTSRCDGCGQDVPFAAARVEGYFWDGQLSSEGEFSRQHGCGTWGPPIVTLGVSRDILETDVDLSTFVVALRDQVRDAQTERREALREELTKALAEARAERPGVSESDDPAAWSDWRKSHQVSWSNSGGDGPIFEESDGTLSAWAYGPAGDGDEVEVS